MDAFCKRNVQRTGQTEMLVRVNVIGGCLEKLPGRGDPDQESILAWYDMDSLSRTVAFLVYCIASFLGVILRKRPKSFLVHFWVFVFS